MRIGVDSAGWGKITSAVILVNVYMTVFYERKVTKTFIES